MEIVEGQFEFSESRNWCKTAI